MWKHRINDGIRMYVSVVQHLQRAVYNGALEGKVVNLSAALVGGKRWISIQRQRQQQQQP